MKTDVIESTEFSITPEAVRSSATNIIPGGNVVVATRVGLGKVCLLGQDTAINQDLRGIVPRNDLLKVRFLYHWLRSVAPLIIQEGTGATVQGVRLPFIKSLLIPIPSPKEQERIVAILDEAFEGIATAKANAQANLNGIENLFSERIERIFRPQKDGWVTCTLGETGLTQTGTTPKTSERANYGTDVPFIKPGDFRPDGSLDYENDGLSSGGLRISRAVPPGSVLMVCIGATIGKCGLTDRVVTTNQQINSWTAIVPLIPRLIYYQMLTKDFQRRVMLSSAQATLPIINKSKWQSLTINFPTTENAQERIVRELDDLRDGTQQLAAAYSQKISMFDELRESLLHQAFTGKL